MLPLLRDCCRQIEGLYGKYDFEQPKKMRVPTALIQGLCLPNVGAPANIYPIGRVVMKYRHTVNKAASQSVLHSVNAASTRIVIVGSTTCLAAAHNQSATTQRQNLSESRSVHQQQQLVTVEGFLAIVRPCLVITRETA